jgi:hypothetical protein
MLKAYLNNAEDPVDDPFYDLALQVADGVPTEADYVYERWSHTKLAIRYLRLVYQRARING